MAEFDLIARIRARAAGRGDVALGIGDDAALLRPPAGQVLAVSTDTLNAGVHFPLDTAPADLGWKALAVNLSDLAAMAAEPAWCTLSLSLPQADEAWLDRFLDGFLALAGEHGVALVGGDTTRGPLSITVTVVGFVPEQQALRRDGARAGDQVWVTGTLGDAAAALALSLPCVDPAGTRRREAAGDAAASLRQRLDRPHPRLAAGLALRGLANAGIDISDGLLADLGHILEQSRVGAMIEIARLPTSEALAMAVAGDERWRLQLSAGDDYELCFTAPPGHHDDIVRALAGAGTAAAVIGRIEAGPGLRVTAPDGTAWSPVQPGYQHFQEPRQ